MKVLPIYFASFCGQLVVCIQHQLSASIMCQSLHLKQNIIFLQQGNQIACVSFPRRKLMFRDWQHIQCFQCHWIQEFFHFKVLQLNARMQIYAWEDFSVLNTTTLPNLFSQSSLRESDLHYYFSVELKVIDHFAGQTSLMTCDICWI